MGGDTSFGPNIASGGVLGRNLDGSSAISHCLLRDNFAELGGAIALENASTVVADCRIVQNVATDAGGGILMTGAASPLVTRSVFAVNAADGAGGGGIMADLGVSPVIKNNVFSGNDALSGSGGAILLDNALAPIITNNTISDNAASASGGGAIALLNTVGALTNNIFSGNLGVAVVELDDASDPALSFNLFDANPDGDYLDFDPSTSMIYTGALDIDGNVTESQNSVGGDSSFLHNPVGNWSEAPTYDDVVDRTTLTDASAPFTSGNFVGDRINPSADATLQALIADFTASTIELAGDYTSLVLDGDPYKVLNYHINSNSPAVDTGRDVAAVAFGATTVDFDEEVRSLDGDGLGVGGTGDGSDFDIGADEVTPPQFMVTRPNGGETFVKGTVDTLTWSSTGDVGGPDVRIDMCRGSQCRGIISSTPNDGSFDWTIPGWPAVSSSYFIKITSVSDPALTDESDGLFTITDTPPSNSITIISPNGGENWIRGQLVTIQWNSSDVTNVNIDLERSNAPALNIATSTPSDGTFDFTVPAAQDLGSDYTIRITDSADPGVTDDSDQFFNVVDAVAGSITATRPNGGEVFARGAVEDITWLSTGDIGGPDVSVIIRRGSNSRVIITSTPNDGSFEWAVPSNCGISSSYFIEVTSVSNPIITDVSDGLFTIY